MKEQFYLNNSRKYKPDFYWFFGQNSRIYKLSAQKFPSKKYQWFVRQIGRMNSVRIDKLIKCKLNNFLIYGLCTYYANIIIYLVWS